MASITRSKLKQLEALKEVRIGYARVSTLDRQQLGLEIQLDALKHCNILFAEKQSGSNDNRVELSQAIDLAKQLAYQDTKVSFCVYKMDRLGRKTSTLLRTIEELKESNIEFVSIKENIDTSTPTGVLMYQLLGIFSEFELNNLRQRTREGLAQAKKNGIQLGNKGLDDKIEANIVHLYQLNHLTVNEIAKKTKVSARTVYNVAKRNNLSRKSKTPCNPFDVKV